MSKATCAVEGCDRQAVARGWCQRHWTVWRKHGDPTYKRQRRLCSIEGCDKKHYGKGWCCSHWKRYAHRPTCSIEDCSNPVQAHGWCRKHLSRALRHGDPLWEASKNYCRVPDCEREVSGNGLCSMHRRRERKTGDPLKKKVGTPNRHEVNAVGDGVLLMTRKDGTVETSLYDLADHETIAAHRWYVNAQGYAVTPLGGRGKVKTVRLNRVLLGLADDDPRRADHENGQILDNRRSNLRILTHQHNVAHQAIVNHRGTSKYRNVYLNPRTGRWIASVRIDRKDNHVGVFDTEEAAAAAVARFRQEKGLPAGY